MFAYEPMWMDGWYRHYVVVLTATLSSSGSFPYFLFGKRFPRTLRTVGTLGRGVFFGVVSVLAFVGAVYKRTQISMSGAIAPAISLTFRAGKLFRRTLVTRAKLRLAPSIYLTGVLVSSGQVGKRVTQAFAAALSFVGTVATLRGKVFYATLTSAGTLVSVMTKNLAGFLAPRGRRNYRRPQHLGGVLGFVGNFLGEIAAVFARAREDIGSYFSGTAERQEDVTFTDVVYDPDDGAVEERFRDITPEGTAIYVRDRGVDVDDRADATYPATGASAGSTDEQPIDVDSWTEARPSKNLGYKD